MDGNALQDYISIYIYTVCDMITILCVLFCCYFIYRDDQINPDVVQLHPDPSGQYLEHFQIAQMKPISNTNILYFIKMALQALKVA